MDLHHILIVTIVLTGLWLVLRWGAPVLVIFALIKACSGHWLDALGLFAVATFIEMIKWPSIALGRVLRVHRGTNVG